MEASITAHEYRERLVSLCARGGRHSLPRRQRDRHVLLHALSRRLEGVASFGEPEVNARISDWLTGTGRSLETDVVSLRRALIDEGFLERRPDGTDYRPSRVYESRIAFDPTAAALDPDLVIEEARAQDAERRRLHEEKGRLERI